MNYMDCLGLNYPTVFASCIGDPTVYANIVWEGGDPLPTQGDLDAAIFSLTQQAQIQVLSAACQTSIMSGFTSNALGSPFEYASGQLDQINLIGSVMDTAPTPANPAGNSCLYKCGPIVNGVTGAYNYMEHTSAQMQQVWQDGVAWKVSQLQIYNSKQRYILALTSGNNTIADIEAVTWTSSP